MKQSIIAAQYIADLKKAIEFCEAMEQKQAAEPWGGRED